MHHFPVLIYCGFNLLLAMLFDRRARHRFFEGPSLPELLVFYIVFAALGLPIMLFVLGSGIKEVLPSQTHPN
jgi:hypothetical protein